MFFQQDDRRKDARVVAVLVRRFVELHHRRQQGVHACVGRGDNRFAAEVQPPKFFRPDNGGNLVAMGREGMEQEMERERERERRESRESRERQQRESREREKERERMERNGERNGERMQQRERTECSTSRKQATMELC